MAGQKTIFLKTTGSQQTWNVPADFSSLVSVEAIASGLASHGTVSPYRSGGAGGAYAGTTSLSISANQTVYYAITTNTDNGETYFSTVSGGPSSTSQGIKAVSGIKGTGSTQTGGSAASCIGTTTYSGGNGGAYGPSTYYGPGGGGGSAGPNGAGKNGGQGNNYAGGGGGCNGGSSTNGSNRNSGGTAGGNGGQGPSGTAGGLGGTSSTSATSGSNGSGGGGGGRPSGTAAEKKGGDGSMYPVWTQTSNSEQAGPGSGGGGGYANSGGLGGSGGGYGSGAGASYAFADSITGQQGIIVFTYNATDTVTITTQPTNQTVKEPATATFSIVASASGGALTYEWQRSDPGTGGAAWGAISGATSSSYTTPATSFATDNGAYYRCVLYIDGVYKATSSVARLYVTPSATGNFFMVF